MSDTHICPHASGVTVCLEEAATRFHEEAHSGVCETGRYRARYFTWGEGPPLLFIPGLCDDALSFLLPISHLSTHFRCIAYDLPEGGEDGACLKLYDHAKLAADVVALMDYLGIGSCDLYAACLGSTIGLTALHRYPDRLPRAVLQAGFAYRYLTPPEVLLAWFATHWQGRMRSLPFHEAAQRYIHFPFFSSRVPNVWEYFLARSGSARKAAVAHRALLLCRFDMRPLLPSIRQPITLVCGDGDTVVDGQYTDVLMKGLPNVRRVDLQNCGHLPMFTHPEVLAGVVRQALESPTDVAPAARTCAAIPASA
jgi:pimeloyl-ACP methyl ester carboxylesterase